MPFSPLRKNRTSDGEGLEEWLVSADPSRQEMAAETFFKMGSERTRTYLVAISGREEKARVKRAVTGGLAIFILAFGIALLLGASSTHHFPTPLFLMINPIIAIAGRPSKLLLKANELIAAQATDVSLLPVIVNAWRLGGFADANIPARSLIRLLPGLEGSDISLLNKTQWTFVLNWLSPRASKIMIPEVQSDLIRAILHACGNLAMSEALPRVRKLAESASPQPEIQQLQQTARNYVALLENTANPLQMVVRR